MKLTGRCGQGGVAKDKISSLRDTYDFNFSGSPTEFVSVFRQFYGPTMNAFDAAGKNGKAEDLKRELDALFSAQNKSGRPDATTIPATFLRVTVSV